ncbi:hypothetical protein GGI23_007328 [Coemansia sp. RSA 2559]|nr:hypothetical protein GGI23_007328 [Coemansia sp. RSA 2559]
MSKSLKDKRVPRYVATSGAKVQRYFPGKAPSGHVDDISASESDYEEEVVEANEFRPNTTNVSEISPIVISDLKAKTTGSNNIKGDYPYSSDEDNAESESDAESKRLLQMRLQMRELANEEDSSDNDNTSDIYSTSAKARSEASQPSRTSSGLETESTDTDSSESPDDYAFQTLLKPMFVPKPQRLSQPHAKDQEAGSVDGEDIELIIKQIVKGRREETSLFVWQQKRQLGRASSQISTM